MNYFDKEFQLLPLKAESMGYPTFDIVFKTMGIDITLSISLIIYYSSIGKCKIPIVT